MLTILFNDNHIRKEDLLKHRDLVQAIVDGRLRFPKIKKMVGMEYQNNAVYRVKTDKKERLLFTYVQHEGKNTFIFNDKRSQL